jgi:hypothetical protein
MPAHNTPAKWRFHGVENFLCMRLLKHTHMNKQSENGVLFARTNRLVPNYRFARAASPAG